MEADLTFQQFELPPTLQKSLDKMDFKIPTPIQAKVLPLALEGSDIIGCAQTGTGKTGAFMIPIVARLSLNPEQTALILTPTRELALQIFEVAKSMILFEKNFGIALLIGGSGYGPQLQQLRRGSRLIIGTPGRVQDHLRQKNLRLEKTNVLVLDEADRMLDMGFAPQIEEILRKMEGARQTFLFTATLPNEIEKIAKKFMKNPLRVMVGPNSRPIEKIKQEVIETTESKKLQILIKEIRKREGSVLIFTRTKHRTDSLSEELEISGFEVAMIHGDRTQQQRSAAIRDFKKGTARILVATDVASRGLDVPNIAHVINFDLPQMPEDFVHRIGRTARAGAEGSALSLITPSERFMWKRILRLISGGGGAGFGEKPFGPVRADPAAAAPEEDRERTPRRYKGRGAFRGKKAPSRQFSSLPGRSRPS